MKKIFFLLFLTSTMILLVGCSPRIEDATNFIEHNKIFSTPTPYTTGLLPATPYLVETHLRCSSKGEYLSVNQSCCSGLVSRTFCTGAMPGMPACITECMEQDATNHANPTICGNIPC